MTYLRQHSTGTMKTFIYGGLLMLILCTKDGWSAQRFCGKALQDVLDHVCVNGFNSKLRNVKKSVEPVALNYNNFKDNVYDSADNELIGNDNIKEEDHDSSLLNSYNANNLFLDKIFGETLNQLVSTNRRRRHFGVYDECCRKPCTYNELLSYCL